MGHALREDQCITQIVVAGDDPRSDAIIISLVNGDEGYPLVCVEAPYALPSVFAPSRIDAVCEALQSLKARVPVTTER